MDTMKIKETTNYDQFRLISGNRQINERHLAQLMGSISEHNLLDANPIIVSQTGEVIDGQHRLEAARRLSLPIYYVVAGIGLTDVLRLNTNSRRWDMDDYLKSYVEQGNPEYITLKNFIEEFGLTPSLSRALLTKKTKSSDGRQRDIERFKRGEFAVTHLEYARQRAQLLLELNPYLVPGVINHREFVAALEKTLSLVKPDELIEKLQQQTSPLGRQATTRGYLRVLEDVINYRRRKPIRLYE